MPVFTRSLVLVYVQAVGDIGIGPGPADYLRIGGGYAGRGVDRNRSDSESVKTRGPLPRGSYVIGDPRNHPVLGPLAYPLTPRNDVYTFGRSGFFIHGDNAKGDDSASYGCIVASRPVREAIRALGLKILYVE